ncbi:MAG: IS630 family transposase [Actinobacteria bacterium]|nr:IS630 family transposase [Actinomycetota bacterium]
MRVARLKEAYPTATKVELWCEDEHRLGLKPIIRKVWSPIGERPLVKVHQRYEWTYLYAFARPKTGEVHWLILPTVNAEVFSLALENFAREVGAGKRKRILLVLDGAGWHTAKKLRVPEGIHLEFLPSHSPELQPSERLWPLSNEGVANRHFERIEEMEEALIERCVALGDQPEVIRSYTRYQWWPNAA